MGDIVNHWLAEECRAEDGIYFADDTFTPVVANVPQLPRRSIAELLNAAPDFWESVYFDQPLVGGSGHVAVGGETSWEGSGFIAILREGDGSLAWLFHTTGAEKFSTATIDGGVVRAISEAHPVQMVWQFPLESPWDFTVTRRDA